MGKNKTLEMVMSGKQDANISFNALCRALRELGFDERIKGSHHIFTREGLDYQPNLQPDGAKAKAYQVKQIRDNLKKANLGE